MLPDAEVVRRTADKYLTHCFFEDHGIPTATVISSESLITWLLVTTMPLGSMMKPEPNATLATLGLETAFRSRKR